MSGSQKRKKREMKGRERGTIPLNSLEVTSASEQGGCKMEGEVKQEWMPSSLHLMIRNSNQWPEHRCPVFGGQGSHCPPWFPQAVCRLLQEHVHRCLPKGLGWGMGSCYCAKCWHWLKLTTAQTLPWKLEAFSKLQSSKVVTSDKFCLCNSYLGEETESWYFLFCHVPRILTSVVFFSFPVLLRYNGHTVL